MRTYARAVIGVEGKKERRFETVWETDIGQLLGMETEVTLLG